ncbi:hypothetical protein BHE74_00013301 [Ensete ventricosum]|nr:hypothetical protein GW17_00034964 [Ensete ventricosum]RWW78479.1 hypothetical protein BHE74_00013301 [Ensete ventricosum]RZR89305.1 hypothetical protein BHM03_00017002 [Ensete ventricosum]
MAALFHASTGRTTELGRSEDQSNRMTIAQRPSAPSTTRRPPQSKKLSREELRDRSANGLCWHCDKLWSHDHHCKKRRLLMIEPIEESIHEQEDLAL